MGQILSGEANNHSANQEIPRILLSYHHLRLGLTNGFFPSGFPTKILYAFLISPMRAKFHAHHTRLDLITLIMFGEMCKL
jgi:hypothetical protein